MTLAVVPIVTVKGRYLWCSAKRFIIKGVVYQRSHRGAQETLDPLADEHFDDVQRDVAAFKDLGLNAIWVYKIDPDLQHDKTMSLLAAAGIYVIATASDHKNRHVINRNCPRQSYNSSVQECLRSTATCMARYANTLGICIAGDLINEYSERMELVEESYEVLAAATLDLKRHMYSEHAKVGQRILPICVADTYWSLANTNTFRYLTQRHVLGRDSDARLDFYCVNHYGSASANTISQPYNDLAWNMIHTLPQFRDDNDENDGVSDQIPIMLSEYSSSNSQRPRLFDETADLYSEMSPPDTPIPMRDVISGGFVYEYFENANHYGLVKLDSGGKITKLADYDNLKRRLHDGI